MAPVSMKRRAPEAKASKPRRVPSSTTDSFAATKDDKRRIKHSNFISRIEKTNTDRRKKRRPSKKLVTTLESLADALPEAQDTEGKDIEFGSACIRHKSLKSRPGAMKKKAKLETLERDRFQKNLVQMAKGNSANIPSTSSGATATSDRWAALRSFIGTTMDKN